MYVSVPLQQTNVALSHLQRIMMHLFLFLLSPPFFSCCFCVSVISVCRSILFRLLLPSSESFIPLPYSFTLFLHPSHFPNTPTREAEDFLLCLVRFKYDTWNSLLLHFSVYVACSLPFCKLCIFYHISFFALFVCAIPFSILSASTAFFAASTDVACFLASTESSNTKKPLEYSERRISLAYFATFPYTPNIERAKVYLSTDFHRSIVWEA